MRVGIPVADLMTGMMATQAILAAVVARDTPGQPHFGKGQHIDLALFDVMFTSLANQLMSTLTSGKPPIRIGNRHPTIVPYQRFETKDTPIIIAVGTDRQFRDLCLSIDMPDLADDPRFSTNPFRVQNRVLLEQLLQQRLILRPAEAWLKACAEHGIPAAPILNILQASEHPQTKARDLIKPVQHPTAGEMAMPCYPARFSGTALNPPECPPQKGQHQKDYE
jgi:formyl-CoA transferase